MSTQGTRSPIAARRAELMAELFLQELEPEFMSSPTTADVGYDLLVGFQNGKGGINTFAVAVRATERPPADRFSIVRRTFERFVHSNIPGLLLVADVKQNTMYYGWLNAGKRSGSLHVSVPLVAVDEASKSALRAQLRAVDVDVPAAG